MQRIAKHDVIIVSDGDVRVPRDFLRNAIAPLTDPEVGLVNCFYRIANPMNAAMRWEALAVNGDFWSQVLQGKDLAPLDFALGAVMITRREQLAGIGGFEALADHLADDFQLGNRIVRKTGKQIALCPVVVDCLSAPMDWSEAWAHQLRWARTIRVSKPLPYAASILSNATFWPMLWAIVQPCKASLLTLAAGLALRIISAQALQARLGAVRGQLWYFWLAPVKDLLQFALWASAFFGNDVVWRGQRFRVQSDGRLVKS
jgi:ceramide glucosyltransferase